MNKFIATAAAAFFALGSAAQAATISVSVLDANLDNYNAAIAGSSVVEDFENLGQTSFPAEDTIGGEVGPSLVTNSVGDFTTAGGRGTGGNVVGSGEQLYLKKDDTFGQDNSVPTDGEWSLNSNDTLGIVWEAFVTGNKAFSRLVFVLMDAADQGAKVEITTNKGGFETLENLGNANRQLIVIDFSERVTSATVTVENANFSIDPNGNNVSKNDGNSLDGAAVVGVVPLPAGGLLLLTGLGALALRRRRKAA